MFNLLINKWALSLTALCFALFACSQVPTDDSSSSERTIFGTTQKGPFVKGSKITLYGMDENIHQTGAHFSTTIDNDHGEYTLKNITLEDRYAWLYADGYYLSELTGKKSLLKIVLNSFVDLSNQDNVNINVLTHLSFDRILYLVKEGKSITEAKHQAEQEVLKAFDFSEEEKSFEQFNIFDSSDASAKLLAISLIILTDGNGGGSATERMAKIALDIETDGIWNDSTTKQKIKDHIAYLLMTNGYDRIPENLQAMGATQTPDYLSYLKKFVGENTTWTNCTEQDEIKTVIGQKQVICRNGFWLRYYGLRDEGMAPVDTAGRYGTLIDERDGHSYKTLDIKTNDGKTVTWMANLLEFDDVPEYSEQDMVYSIPGIGRSYTHHQVLNLPESTDEYELFTYISENPKTQGICPNGWRIPNSDDYKLLWDSIKDDKETKELLIYTQYKEGMYDSTSIDQTSFSNELDENCFLYGDDIHYFSINKQNPTGTSYTCTLRCVKD